MFRDVKILNQIICVAHGKIMSVHFVGFNRWIHYISGDREPQFNDINKKKDLENIDKENYFGR